MSPSAPPTLHTYIRGNIFPLCKKPINCLQLEALESEWKYWKIKIEQVCADNQQLQELLQAKNQRGWTFLHYACFFIDIKSLLFIKSKLNSSQFRQAVSATTDKSSSTPLFDISEARNNWIQDGFAFMSHLLQPFDSMQICSLIKIRNMHGVTVLHTLVCKGHDQIIRILFSALAPKDRLQLLSLRTESEPACTAAELAGYYKQSQCLRMLEDFKIEAVRMKKTPTKHALILYNPNNRVGADEEAQALTSSFQASGKKINRKHYPSRLSLEVFKAVAISPLTIEWSTTVELQELVSDTLNAIENSCTLLVVCIMAHGSIGCLQCSDGSRIPLNDILNQIIQGISPDIQMIAIIQACQGYPRPAGFQSTCNMLDMARRVDPPDNMHIDLTRPNSVLLMATVTGGEAIRGAYTGAIAEQIRKADGKTGIHEMHTQAVNQMMKNGKLAGSTQQIPEYRDTLMGKKLILPKIPKTLEDF